jgi:hypothetical protein
MRNRFGTIVQNISNAAHLEYRILFYKTRSPEDNMPLIPSLPTGVSSRNIQPHSPPLTGTYTISQGGVFLRVGASTDILASATPMNIQKALNEFYNSTEISVVQVQPSQLVDQIVYSINYVGIQDPLDLTIDVAGLSGGINSSFNLLITINRNYSD